ncbi:hypothetical protein D3C81_1961740 [compost metagenome]
MFTLVCDRLTIIGSLCGIGDNSKQLEPFVSVINLHEIKRLTLSILFIIGRQTEGGRPQGIERRLVADGKSILQLCHTPHL